MTEKTAKLLCDENVPYKVVGTLACLIEPLKLQVELRHLKDVVGLGQKDEVWLPKVKNEGWTVLTGDSGRCGFKKGQPLPKICVECGISLVVMSPKVHELPMEKKILVIISVFPEIVRIASAVTCSHWKLQQRDSKTPNHVGTLVPLSLAKISPPSARDEVD